MKEKSIIFRGDGVLAILEGRKTQTRRVITEMKWQLCRSPEDEPEWFIEQCPYGKIGDRLWVREAWAPGNCDNAHPKESDSIIYRADYCGEALNYPWRSSRFMPRWMSRITLEIIWVRVERLQEITPVDCKAEGIFIRPPHNPGVEEALKHLGEYNRAFEKLWDSINAKRGYGWGKNPYVWVIEYKKT